MIVLHGAEGAVNHRVLKVGGRFHGGDFAGEVLRDAEVSGAPCDTLVEIDEAGGYSGFGYGLLSEMHVSGQMDFYTSGEVEAAFDGRVDLRELFEGDHGFSRLRV